MKKLYTLFVILALVSFAHNVNAQFKYGPRLGAGYSDLGVGDGGIGFYGGGFLNAEVWDNMGFQGEFLYNLRTDSKTITGVTFNYNAKFLDLPVYFYFPISNHIRGLVGLNFSKFLSGNCTYSSAGQSFDDKLSIGSGSGYAAGLDFHFDSPFKLGIRYNSTTGNSDASGIYPATAGSQTISITASYLLDW